MKPSPTAYALELIERRFRRAYSDGTLAGKYPKLREPITKWLGAVVGPAATVATVMDTYQHDELMQRRLHDAHQAFLESPDFEQFMTELAGQVLEDLVAEGVFTRTTAPDGTIVYNWADDESS